jgi:hypothetical protein
MVAWSILSSSIDVSLKYLGILVRRSLSGGLIAVPDFLSAAYLRWFVDFIDIGGLAMDLFPDDSLGDLGQIGNQGGIQLFELGPQDLLEEALWRPAMMV